MLKLEQIEKSYGDNHVLKGVNLHIKKGEIYGLVGANGAGKTTLFNIIAQILDYNGGKIYLEDKEVKTINDLAKKVGYIIDIPSLYEYLTALEHLEFLYSTSGKTPVEIKARAIETLALVGLIDVANKKIKEFSRGMKQRMGIAAGLIFEPDLIIMDEPSSALDPKGRAEVANIIKDLKKQGKTIILSTHILSDIEKICDRIGLLINGKIEIEGSVQEVLANYSENKLKITCMQEDAEKLNTHLNNLNFKSQITENGLEVEFNDQTQKKNILIEVANQQTNFLEIAIKRNSLEEIFIQSSAKGETKWTDLKHV